MLLSALLRDILMEVVMSTTDDEIQREREDKQTGDDVDHRTRDLVFLALVPYHLVILLVGVGLRLVGK